MTDGLQQPEVRYTRPVPTGWDELVDYSRVQIDPSATTLRTPEMTEAMLRPIGMPDNGELDTQRYYGIGLVMCGIAKELQCSATRRETIKKMGRALQSVWRVSGSTERDSLRPRDISGFHFRFAFSNIVSHAGASLSPEVTLLNDALHAEASARSFANEPGVPYGGIEGARSLLKIHQTPGGGIRHGIAAEFVGRQVANGASSVLRVALTKRAEFTAKSSPQTNTVIPQTAVEIMDEAGDENLALRKVGISCAALRLDEFADLEDYIDVNPEGKVVFRRDRMIRSSELTPPLATGDSAVVLHTKRLRCPAMFVEGLLPCIIEMIPQAIRAADKIALGKEQEGDY